MATEGDLEVMSASANAEGDLESQDSEKSDPTTLRSPQRIDVAQVRSYARSPIITLLVGDGQVEYTAHKAVLMAKCPFFEKCFNSGMTESHSNRVNLPEEDCETFDHFIEYIYEGKVNFSIGDDSDFDKEVSIAMKDFALAEKFCMLDWQNLVMDCLLKVLQDGIISPDQVSWVVDHVSETSKLYQLVMAEFAYNTVFYLDKWLTTPGNEEESDRYRKGFDTLCTKEGFPVSQFIWDILKMQKSAKKDVPDPSHQGCKYHVHLDGQTCEKTKNPELDKKRK